EMLSFFSDVTGVSYPWPKYSQVAVRDYVSGAMENTTAVIFGEFMHGTDRSLIDVETNEKIVAHEMFHHWFGDFVTCESWSNLTLNEGFANYSEYLWMEKKHGRDAADYHMLTERSGYFGSVRQGEPHELIWYDYDDKEQMFDAHSYNKGGAVLHMLRGYLGDEAFFTSFKKYLIDNQYSAVEVDELRMAFEDTTGEDLQWFFDQWFLKAGHPELSLTREYEDGKILLTVEQTQSTDYNVPAIFRLPTQVAIFTNGSTTPEIVDIVVDQRKQTFTFPSEVEPDVVVFDPRHDILATYSYTKTAEALAAQFKGAPSFIDRYLVVQRLANKGDSEAKTTTLTAALQDPFHQVRNLTMQVIGEQPTPEQLELIRGLAKNDPHSAVRSTALGLLTVVEDASLVPIAKMALEARPFPVVAAGLQALVAASPEEAMKEASKLESIDNSTISSALAAVYSASGDVSKLPYIEKQMDNADGFDAVEIFDGYRRLMSMGDASTLKGGIEKLKGIGMRQAGSPWRRYAATKSLNDLREEMKAAGDKAEQVVMLKTIIDGIKAVETESQLVQIYQNFGN
ncbi:MAG: M1 family aminopeptidase, partial [Bacteroidota bacterium]